MIKLRYGYLFIGLVMGLVFLWQFLAHLPDGKLRITICDVGQGDGSYVRFPDGRDMVIDGGPSSQILLCLGKKMPFWDRHLDAVILTHPDQDHFKGLLDVVDRYSIGMFIHSGIDNPTPLYRELEEKIQKKQISVHTVTSQDEIRLERVTLDVLWPAQSFLSQTNTEMSASRNDYAIVFHLRYGKFDAIFTGDSDQRVEPHFTGEYLTSDGVDLLKVPHHGSKTGMTQAFVDWLQPTYAVISAGKRNTYGHPSPFAINLLEDAGAKVYRTDTNGAVTIVTDGNTMTVTAER